MRRRLRLQVTWADRWVLARRCCRPGPGVAGVPAFSGVCGHLGEGPLHPAPEGVQQLRDGRGVGMRAAALVRGGVHGTGPLREGRRDRRGLLLQHSRPDVIAGDQDRERGLHHPPGRHPAGLPHLLGRMAGCGVQGPAGAGEHLRGVGVEGGRDRRGRAGRRQRGAQVRAADADRQVAEEHLQAVPVGADLGQVGEGHAGSRQQPREPGDEVPLDAADSLPVLIRGRLVQHRDQIGVGPPGDRVASGDAAVQVAAVQPRTQLGAEQVGRGPGHPGVGGLHIGQVGLGEDVPVGVQVLRGHAAPLPDAPRPPSAGRTPRCCRGSCGGSGRTPRRR